MTLVFLGGAAAGRLGDFDGWWHLKVGELILDRQSMPRYDVFSWTNTGDRWHTNSWASDVAFELARRGGGLAGVAVLRAVLFMALLVSLHVLSRRAGARPWPAALATLVAGMPLVFFATERPQLFSYVLLAATVPLTIGALRGSNRHLAGLAVLVAVWANLHGVAALGVAVVAATAAGDALRHRRLSRPLLVAVLPALATLANPFGPQLFVDSGVLRSLGRNLMIVEYRHPDLTEAPDLLVTVVAALALVGLVRTGRWRRPDVWFPLALLAAVTIDAIRSAPLFVVLAAPEVALALGTMGSPALRARLQPHLGPLAAGGALILGVGAVLGTLNAGQAGRVDRAKFPVGAVAAIPAGCRLLNEYEHGGYIIATRWPEVPVSQDSRTLPYGEEALEAQERLMDDRPGTDTTLRRLGVDCVLARPDRALVRRLRATTEWDEVAAERAGVLLVRR